MRRDVLEARHLPVLLCQVVDRVEDEVCERERPLDPRPGKIADRDRDVFAAGFLAQLRDHGRREVDTGQANPALGERHRDAPGANAEFEHRTVTGEGCEEIDDGFDLHPRSRLVVTRGDFLAEVILDHPDRFSFPCRFACRSPTPKIQSPAGIATKPITTSGQMSPQTAPTL